jgi:hypothetical protein
MPYMPQLSARETEREQIFALATSTYTIRLLLKLVAKLLGKKHCNYALMEWLLCSSLQPANNEHQPDLCVHPRPAQAPTDSQQ